MRRRRGRISDPAGFMGMDSFMDIVFNILGALFFVIIYVVLASQGAKGKVTTPLVSLSDTEDRTFECRANTVFYPEIVELFERAGKIVKDAKAQGIDDARALVKRVQQAGVGNEFYKFVIRGEEVSLEQMRFYRTSTFIEPLKEARGEAGEALKAAGSRFRESLRRLDPGKNHIFFLVRHDSFEVFHTARRVAMEMGFKVGWHPLEADKPISVGSGGDINPGMVQ